MMDSETKADLRDGLTRNYWHIVDRLKALRNDVAILRQAAVTGYDEVSATAIEMIVDVMGSLVGDFEQRHKIYLALADLPTQGAAPTCPLCTERARPPYAYQFPDQPMEYQSYCAPCDRQRSEIGGQVREYLASLGLDARTCGALWISPDDIRSMMPLDVEKRRRYIHRHIASRPDRVLMKEGHYLGVKTLGKIREKIPYTGTDGDG